MGGMENGRVIPDDEKTARIDRFEALPKAGIHD